MATFDTDSSGQKYVEMETSVADEKLRLTFIEAPKYDDRPALRIQIRDASGHLRQGPEVPVDILSDIEDAIGWARLLACSRR